MRRRFRHRRPAVREFATPGAALAYLRQFRHLAIGPTVYDLIGAAHKAAGRNKEKHRRATIAVRSLRAAGYDVERPANYGGGGNQPWERLTN